MFTLLPEVGVELPHRAGLLRFGMSEHRAQWAISTLADVREERLCIRSRAAGVAWAFFAEYEDLVVSVSGGPGPGGHAPGLDEIRFARRGDPLPLAPAAVPVVYEGIDLFGYPAPEVEEALAALHPHATGEETRAEEFGLTLGRHAAARSPGPAGREPAATRYLASVTLTGPERHRLMVG
ncbi:hypothetical protein [Actinoallomurus rhizosphaericola]|uniref:hypothetical protein n=1 Tax=Actinoallomurus rhizosphaericola TaxID=2952536 RepID=UPI002090D76E|nr:hypothetical protein [Actinoallomurus rhizosphaericola]MCO5993365.1 hypothetical protein [Actinoallomurus rhizosphaericola]